MPDAGVFFAAGSECGDMPHRSPESLPDYTARNLLKRAEQLRVIASAVTSVTARDSLLRSAAAFEAQADAASQHSPPPE